MRKLYTTSRIFRSVLLGFFAGAVTLSSFAQTSARIRSAIDESSRTTLSGNVSAFARPEFDQGAAPASQTMSHVKLLLKRTDAQEAKLKTFLEEVQDPKSANYHKWLTPAQVGSLYGASDEDVQTLTTWLQARGLTVESVSPSKTSIDFSGTVAQVQSVFQTEVHTFSRNGAQFYSNVTDPQIPVAISGVVSGVARLNNIAPKSMRSQGRPGLLNTSTGRIDPVNASASTGVRPNLSYQDSSGYNYLFMVPADAATIYNTPNSSLNGSYSSGSSYTGSGVSIGIAADSTITTSYVTAYRSLFVGDSTAPTVTVVGTNPGENDDADEAYLDSEFAGGLAPGASIIVYVSSDLFTGIEKAISDNTVSILSVSFGVCERGMTTSDNTYVNGLWQTAAAQGISVTVSTGDSGSAGCDDPNSETTAQYGLGVNGLASTPYNIAVGGTDYDVLATSFSTYVTAPTSSSSWSGSSSSYYRTAKGYITENPWNDSTQTNGVLASNVPYTGKYANIVGGSGGKSSCITNTSSYTNTSTNLGTCSAGYSKPSWQKGTGVPSDSVRDIPDVSLLAADGAYGAFWLYCHPDSTYNYCIKGSAGTYFDAVGGTSAAAPAFAGMLALVVQATGSRQGQAAQTLYNLYNGSYASSVFHDVTTGNISVPCTSGSTDCSKNTAGNYFQTGYDAGTGYDLATGLGSVNVTNMIAYWSTGASSGTSTSSFSLSGTAIYSFTAGSSATSTITVTPSNYSGTVTLSCSVTGPSGASSSYYPTCSFSPTSVTFASGATAASTSTLTIKTTTRTTTTSSKVPSRVNPWYTAGGSVMLSSFLLVGFAGYRRKWRTLIGSLSVVLFVLVLGGLSGCGGGGSSSSSSGSSSSGTTTTTTGTTAGTYTIIVTGTDTSNVTASTTISVTVN